MADNRFPVLYTFGDSQRFLPEGKRQKKESSSSKPPSRDVINININSNHNKNASFTLTQFSKQHVENVSTTKVTPESNKGGTVPSSFFSQKDVDDHSVGLNYHSDESTVEKNSDESTVEKNKSVGSANSDDLSDNSENGAVAAKDEKNVMHDIKKKTVCVHT